MDAEKLAMQRRIDTLDEYATRLHAALTEYERENARLKAELETVKKKLEGEREFRCHFAELSWKYRKELGRMKRERDALKHDLYLECYDSPHACYVCKHGQDGVTKCKRDMDDCFEWRGVQENGGADDV